MNIGEVFIALGFDVDESKLKSFSDKINGLQKSMLVLSASAAGAVFGLESFMRGSVESATALENLKDATGENIIAVEKWMAAGNKANSLLNYDAIRESIMGVNQAMAAGTLGENSSIFGKMGISPFGKDGKAKLGTEFLDEVRRNLPTIIKRYAPWQGLKGLMPDLSALGVNQGLLQALKLNDSQFADYSKNYQVVEKTLQQNKKLGQDIADLTQKFQNFKDTIVGDWAEPVGKALDQVMPHFQNIIEGLKAIHEKTYGIATVVAAGLAIMFSPLFAAGAAAILILETLDKIGQMNKLGVDGWANQHSGSNQQQIKDLVDKFKGKSDKSWEDIIWKKGYERYDNQEGSPAQSGSAAPSTVPPNISQTNNFEINGASDPQAVTDEMGKILNKQFRDAYGHMNGVDR